MKHLPIYWPEWSDLALARQAQQFAMTNGECCIHMHGTQCGLTHSHLADDHADCIGIVTTGMGINDVLRMIVRGKADSIEDELCPWTGCKPQHNE